MTICGDKYAPLAASALRSLHRSARQHEYDVNLYALHDNAAAPSRLAQLWNAAAEASMTRVLISWLRVDSHAPGAQRFRMCSTTRLALPKLLPEDLDVIIYLDVDVLIVGDLTRLASIGAAFNASQWAAFAPEDGTWYTSERYHHNTGRTTNGSKKRHVPFYPPAGINAGIFVVSLQRWSRSAFPWFRQSFRHEGYAAPLGDQDVLNAYFEAHPDELALLPCKWNRRTDSACSRNLYYEADGIYHGNRGVFAQESAPWPGAHAGGEAEWHFFSLLAKLEE